jgi:hypothetical protein
MDFMRKGVRFRGIATASLMLSKIGNRLPRFDHLAASLPAGLIRGPDRHDQTAGRVFRAQVLVDQGGCSPPGRRAV